MAVRDTLEVRVDRPDQTVVILKDEESHGPVELSDGIGRYELRAESWIAEDQ